MGQYTFTILKPKTVKNGNAGQVLKLITEGGFRIAAMRMLRMTKDEAENFYKIHSERPFYADLVKFMTEGPVIVAVLEKENAVKEYRNYIGATNPAEAKEGTIRNLYGASIQANAVHGSDSDENAMKEIKFFFSATEIFDKEGNIVEL